MQKKVLSLFLISILVFSLTACFAQSGNNNSDGKDNQQPAQGETTFTIVDHTGDEVEIPSKIERVVIVQVPLVSTYVMYMGGNIDKLVGLSASVVDELKETVLAKIVPEVLDVETSFYRGGDLSIEELMKLKPDVVLYAGKNKQHKELFKKALIPAVGFATSDGVARTADSSGSEPDPTMLYADWLLLLEEVFGERGKMDEVIGYGDSVLEMIKERVATVPENERPSTMLLCNYVEGSHGVSGETGDFGANWLRAIGVNNVAKGVKGVGNVNLEQIYNWDPDLMFMRSSGRDRYLPEDLLENKIEGEDWSPISAIQKGQVYTSGLGQSGWYTPNPDAPLVVQWLAKKAYPKLFEDIDLRKEIKDYYKSFYSYELNEKEIEGIVNPTREN